MLRLSYWVLGINLLFLAFTLNAFALSCKTRITLTWEYKTPPPDLKGFILYKAVGEDIFKPIAFIDDPDARKFTLIDWGEETTTVRFGLKAIDRSNLISKMSNIASLDWPPCFPPIITHYEYNNQSRELLINWEVLRLPQDFKAFKVVLIDSRMYKLDLQTGEEVGVHILGTTSELSYSGVVPNNVNFDAIRIDVVDEGNSTAKSLAVPLIQRLPRPQIP